MKIKRIVEEFTDYGTGKVIGDNIFDNRTHTSFYDDLISNPKRAEEKYNLKTKIVNMSPEEYYEECANKIFSTSVDSLKKSRATNKEALQEIEDIIVNHNTRVFLPYINYAENQQEGLHRMMVAAKLFGWNHKFPVLVVEYADDERAEKEKSAERTEEIERRIRKAIKDTLQYHFSDDDEVVSELEYHLDEYLDDEYISSLSGPELNISKDRKIINQKDKFIITCENARVELYKEDIDYSVNLDKDIEEIDVDEDDQAALSLPFEEFLKYIKNKH